MANLHTTPWRARSTLLHRSNGEDNVTLKNIVSSKAKLMHMQEDEREIAYVELINLSNEVCQLIGPVRVFHRMTGCTINQD